MEIHTIDCNYLHPQFAAAFLIIKNGRGILIENNTEKCIPQIERCLKHLGLGFEAIDYLFVTHAHLDHAGASGHLMERCPRAQFRAHPKAIEHLAEPSKLIEGVRGVYGQERFDQWYGTIKPIPRSRSVGVKDGETIEWQGIEFKFLHTRGHANHHCCIFEPNSRTVFTGDTFGLCYPALQEKGLFIFPTTSPTGFEPGEAIKSIRRIVALKPQVAYLTHFGALFSIKRSGDQLIKDLERIQSIIDTAATKPLDAKALATYCQCELTQYLQGRLQASGIDWRTTHPMLALDIELNAAGMAHAVGYSRNPPERSTT